MDMGMSILYTLLGHRRNIMVVKVNCIFKKLNSLEWRIGHFNKKYNYKNSTVRNSHFIYDFQFQNYYQQQSIKTTLI